MRANLSTEQCDALRLTLRRVLSETKPWKSPTLSLSVVARLSGVRPHYLSALFRHDGTSFADTLNGYRVREARRILEREPHIKTRELAYRSGFGSIGFLAIAFEKQYGVTPAGYRKQLQNKN